MDICTLPCSPFVPSTTSWGRGLTSPGVYSKVSAGTTTRMSLVLSLSMQKLVLSILSEGENPFLLLRSIQSPETNDEL